MATGLLAVGLAIGSGLIFTMGQQPKASRPPFPTTVYLSPPSPGFPISLPQTVSVTYTAQVTAVGDNWNVNEEISVPSASADRIDKIIVYSTLPGLGKGLSQPLQPGDGVRALPAKMPTDWASEIKDGLLTFSRGRTIPINAISPMPFSATDEIPLPAIDIDPGIKLRIGEGSVVTVTAPRNMIRTIDPPANPTPIPGDLELATVTLHSNQRALLRIESLSPPVRNELGKGIVGFSFSGAAVALVGAAGVVFSGVAALLIEHQVAGRWKAREERPPRRRSTKKAPPKAAPATTLENPTSSPDVAGDVAGQSPGSPESTEGNEAPTSG